MGTIKIPYEWCIYINALFIQSQKTETYLVNFFLYINSDIFVSLYFMVISHTSIHFKNPYHFKNQLNDEKLSFFEAISFNSWFFKWFNYDHHIYLYIVSDLNSFWSYAYNIFSFVYASNNIAHCPIW